MFYIHDLSYIIPQRDGRQDWFSVYFTEQFGLTVENSDMVMCHIAMMLQLILFYLRLDNFALYISISCSCYLAQEMKTLKQILINYLVEHKSLQRNKSRRGENSHGNAIRNATNFVFWESVPTVFFTVAITGEMHTV